MKSRRVKLQQYPRRIAEKPGARVGGLVRPFGRHSDGVPRIRGWHTQQRGSGLQATRALWFEGVLSCHWSNAQHQRWEPAAHEPRTVTEPSGWFPSAECCCWAENQTYQGSFLPLCLSARSSKTRIAENPRPSRIINSPGTNSRNTGTLHGPTLL